VTLTEAMERVNQLAEGADVSPENLQALAVLLRDTTVRQHQFETAIADAVRD
jgi:hypothetical protein